MTSGGAGQIWRAERAKAARRHHPDLGGDLQEYLRVTGEIDRRLGHRTDPALHGLVSGPGGHTAWRNSKAPLERGCPT